LERTPSPEELKREAEELDKIMEEE